MLSMVSWSLGPPLDSLFSSIMPIFSLIMLSYISCGIFPRTSSKNTSTFSVMGKNIVSSNHVLVVIFVGMLNRRLVFGDFPYIGRIKIFPYVFIQPFNQFFQIICFVFVSWPFHNAYCSYMRILERVFYKLIKQRMRIHRSG